MHRWNRDIDPTGRVRIEVLSLQPDGMDSSRLALRRGRMCGKLDPERSFLIPNAVRPGMIGDPRDSGGKRRPCTIPWCGLYQAAFYAE